MTKKTKIVTQTELKTDIVKPMIKDYMSFNSLTLENLKPAELYKIFFLPASVRSTKTDVYGSFAEAVSDIVIRIVETVSADEKIRSFIETEPTTAIAFAGMTRGFFVGFIPARDLPTDSGKEFIKHRLQHINSEVEEVIVELELGEIQKMQEELVDVLLVTEGTLRHLGAGHVDIQRMREEKQYYNLSERIKFIE